MLRKNLEDRFLIVTPGVRPVDDKEIKKGKVDQKRTTGVEEAFRNGADYIVIDRPILKVRAPLAAAKAIQQQIAGLFSSSNQTVFAKTL